MDGINDLPSLSLTSRAAKIAPRGKHYENKSGSATTFFFISLCSPLQS